MKVRRQNLNEEYNITSDWVSEFASNLEKNADFLSNIRNMVNKRKDFATIEEKMADLRARSGFDLVKNNDKDSGNKKEAASEGGCCEEKSAGSSCESCNDDEYINLLKGVLSYVGQFVSKRFQDDDKVSFGKVITHCREEAPDDLRFSELERRLDHSKFKSVVENIIQKHTNNSAESNIDIGYTSEADTASAYDDDIADYVNHAQTG